MSEGKTHRVVSRRPQPGGGDGGTAENRSLGASAVQTGVCGVGGDIQGETGGAGGGVQRDDGFRGEGACRRRALFGCWVKAAGPHTLGPGVTRASVSQTWWQGNCSARGHSL